MSAIFAKEFVEKCPLSALRCPNRGCSPIPNASDMFKILGVFQ